MRGFSSGRAVYYSCTTFDAAGPLGPSTTSKVTRASSSSVLNPSDWIAVWCTKTSLPPSPVAEKPALPTPPTAPRPALPSPTTPTPPPQVTIPSEPTPPPTEAAAPPTTPPMGTAPPTQPPQEAAPQLKAAPLSTTPMAPAQTNLPAPANEGDKAPEVQLPNL